MDRSIDFHYFALLPLCPFKLLRFTFTLSCKTALLYFAFYFCLVRVLCFTLLYFTSTLTYETTLFFHPSGPVAPFANNFFFFATLGYLCTFHHHFSCFVIFFMHTLGPQGLFYLLGRGAIAFCDAFDFIGLGLGFRVLGFMF